jgi:hypothetical protein
VHLPPPCCFKIFITLSDALGDRMKVQPSLFVSFGDLDNNTFKGLTSLLSVEQEIQYDEHT